MADNISSQYSNLFGGRVASNAAPALPGANAPASVPAALPTDRVSLTAARPDMAIAVPTTTATGEMRNELLTLQADLQRINKQVESLIARLDAQGPGPASTPAPTDDVPVDTASTIGGSYEVQAGDYLWKIAKEQLGDANRWPEIYELNKEAIGDNPNLIAPGLELTLPASSRPARPGQVDPRPPQQQPTWPPPQQPSWPPQQPQFPPTNNYPPFPGTNGPALPPANNYPSLPPANNFPPALPPSLPPAPPALPPLPPTNNFPPYSPQPMRGTPDVQVNGPSRRQLSDQDAMRLAAEFGLTPPNAPLTPDVKANVAMFLDEMDSYETSNKGKVFGPGMEALAANPQEVQAIRNSVMQIQQALDILIKAGRLRVMGPNGQPIPGISATGNFFKVDAQGRELRGPNGAPVMDDAFVAAVTQFKQSQGIHQNYKLADGTYAINEYVGPATVEALKKALLEVQAQRR